MSAPDTPTPKSAPSLLGDAPAPVAGKASAAPANGSRILANLEGRVVPPVAPPRAKGRSNKVIALVALCLIAAGGFGAWHTFDRGSRDTHAAAAAPAADKPVAVADKPAAASAPATIAAASAPQTATIVADNDADDAQKPGAGASASSDDGRLSRALSDGAKDANASGAMASAAPSASASADHKHDAKDARAESKADSRHDARTEAKKARHATAVAQAKKHDAHHAGSKDDSDADLLAVLVARTKPSDGKLDQRPVKVAASPSLAQQVKACGQRGFFEEQLCRWRVCDGHWGKDAACPAAARANTEH